MPQDKIEILIEAKVKEAIDGLDALKKKSRSLNDKGLFSQLKENWLGLTAAVAGVYMAVNKVIGVVNEFVNAAVKKQAALTKLKAFTDALSISYKDAEKGVKELTKDGLVPFSDMAQNLSTLLAGGLSLPKAIELLKTAKDNAILNREAHYTLTESLKVFSEGMKNANSRNTDAIGISTNYDKALQNECKALGLVKESLSDKQKIELVANAFIKEGSILTGSAARESEKYAGSQAKLDSNMTILKETIGTQLMPAMADINKETTKSIQKFTEFIKHTGAANVALSILKFIFDTIITNFKVGFGFLSTLFSPVIEGIKAIIQAFEVLTGEGTMKQKFEALKNIGIKSFDNIKNTAIDNSLMIKDSFVKMGEDIKKIANDINIAQNEAYKEDAQNFSDAQDAKKEKFIATEEEIRLFKELTKTQQDEIDRLTNETQFADEEQKLQDKIRRLQDYLDNYILSDEQLKAITAASVEYHNQLEDLKLKKKLDILNLALSSSSQVYNEIATLHGQLITNRINQLTKENIEFNRKLKDRKDKGLLTEEEYNKEVAKADLNMRKEIAKNERKAAIMDKTAKALAIIGNVAAGIASAYVPYIPGVSEFRAGVVATMGAIQGATLAATPLPEIPEFAQGGSFITDHPQLFLAGERGREQVQVTPLNQMTTENKNLNLEGANIYITTNNVDDMIEQLQRKAESMGVSMFGR